MRVGFVGAGMMGGALIHGIIESRIARPDDIWAGDIDEERLAELREKYGINATTDNEVVVENSDVLILAVKPQVLPSVLSHLEPESQLVVSIAAGVPTRLIEQGLPRGARVVRVMPNICATVGEAASAITPGTHATTQDLETAREILGAVGRVVVVRDEDLMDAVTGLSGSGPAYVFTFIEAMADAGVYEGLDRRTSLVLAAQTVLGAARMLLVEGEHPMVLKDRVTSPGGTTIRGMRALEEGFRGAVIRAVVEGTRRSRELGQGSDE